jgi:NAD(P)-dependent dehydrogenase (short-subunit alcohol dehydrogenase family)
MGDMLQDRVAVITGSGNGLGRAHAIGMAAQGASYSQLKRE